MNEISIFSPLGAIVYTTKSTDQIIKIELNELPAGMYLMVTNADGTKSYNKFVVR
jgi:hypothetical protein